MSNGGTDMTTEEAADALRGMRSGYNKGELVEVFQTGGGLPTGERTRLQRAIDVLGAQRASEILGIEVPGEGVPGEQSTLTGESYPDVARERAEPPVRGQRVSLSDFEGREPAHEGRRERPDHGPPDRVIDRSFEVTRDNTTLHLPNAGLTWERRSKPDRGIVEWRSNNVDGYDTLYLVNEGPGEWTLAVATVGADGVPLDEQTVTSGTFAHVGEAAVDYIENHPDGREEGESGNR